jgi:predicted phosphoribosyltransferase
VFRDREDAGRRLAAALEEYRGVSSAIVLGIPRGGVVVAAEVARALHLPLDVAVAAKVGSPGNPEYAIGAVAPDGEVIVNPAAGFSAEEVRRLAGPALNKIGRYLAELREGRPEPALAGRTVLLVDDGLATGLTAQAAVAWLDRQLAEKVVLAVPVAAASSVDALSEAADRVVALEVPPGFAAVGQFYQRFGQTTDAEVRALLSGAPIGR